MGQDDLSQLKLEPRLVARYLTNLGWNLEILKNNIRRMWLPEDNQDTQVEIFLNFEPKTAKRDVYFALTTISQLYAKSPEALAGEIQALAYDVITSKIPSEYVKNDSIELRIASQYIERMKLFLAASATTEISGERHYKRVLKEAVEYSERCRFGHTFRGSFGFHVESPVGLNDEPMLLGVEQTRPFERRVVERIAVGLSSLSDAVKQQDPSMIVQEEHGFSANMCDSIADMVEDIEVSKIDIGIAFSTEWYPKSTSRTQNFTVEFRDLELLREASKNLRIEDSPRQASIFGRIKRLETEGNPADLLEDKARREIEVSWLNEDNHLIHVKMALSPEEYLEAVEAHKAGRIVSATGILAKQGRTWRLTEVETFNILNL